jgi:hypothetical protein
MSIILKLRTSPDLELVLVLQHLLDMTAARYIIELGVYM